MWNNELLSNYKNITLLQVWLFCEVFLFCTILPMKVRTESEGMCVAMWQFSFLCTIIMDNFFWAFSCHRKKIHWARCLSKVWERCFFQFIWKQSFFTFSSDILWHTAWKQNRRMKMQSFFSSLISILKIYWYFDIEGNTKNSQRLFSFLLYYMLLLPSFKNVWIFWLFPWIQLCFSSVQLLNRKRSCCSSSVTVQMIINTITAKVLFF